ncbi:tRNA (adenosine(37)-N6)-threonylcarbamoyltransferase complex ATPase subunit type 1 TsaE [Trueperella sp. LYQ143]|uniref:tRNA (adenosine(37)-N6)-threonylcarbamoyltransferase complex ATPase subunit type 1 TsaE n=1 Tax=unclassified Trueperella TaxID=2630174 RepID=UPI003983C3B0
MKIQAATVDDMHRVGSALGKWARGGDLLMLNGPLGAGKTTLTQGIARGMNIAAQVSSPTFVIAQIYRGQQIDLVHVDAYRLSSLDELDALDLDASLDDSLTVVEWGAGKVEVLSQDRVEVDIERPIGSEAGNEPDDLFDDAPRTLTFRAIGPRATAYMDDVRTALADMVISV